MSDEQAFPAERPGYMLHRADAFLQMARKHLIEGNFDMAMQFYAEADFARQAFLSEMHVTQGVDPHLSQTPEDMVRNLSD